MLEAGDVLRWDAHIARRAILSVIAQRGGKVRMQKRVTHTMLGEEERFDRQTAFNAAQFNSAHTNWLVDMGLIRARRIFWEITAEGKAALEGKVRNAA